MKKIITLLFLFFMFFAATAQQQHQKKNIFNTVHKTPDIAAPKANVWKWDTIITYDTTNVYFEMHIRQFDPIANETTIQIKKWQNQDSIWMNNERDTYTYNASNDSLTWLTELWQDNDWTNLSKYIYTFDSGENLLSQLICVWENSQWEIGQRDTYTYDANGNNLTKLSELWENSSWTNRFRDTYNYDTTGDNILHIYEKWLSGDWNNVCRETMTYDSSGKMLTYLNEMADSIGTWGNCNKYENFYDSVGNNINCLSWAWDADSGWYMTGKNIYTYDNSGNRLSRIHQSYNYQTHWVNESKGEYTYDIDGNLLTENDYGWDGFFGNWENVLITDFSYDGNGNSLTENAQRWFGYWTPWLSSGIVYSNKEIIYYLYNCYRYEAHYNSFNSCSANFTLYPDTLTPHQYYILNMAAGIPPVSYVWSWGDGTFDYTALPGHTYDVPGFYNICLTITDGTGCTTTYCDSSYLAKQNTNTMVTVNVISTTGVTENSINNLFTVFPNPAKNTLTISGINNSSIVEVYNISGRMLLIKQLTTPEIDISTLAKGLYFIKLTTQGGSVVKKFVKE